MKENRDRQEQNTGKVLVETGVFLLILNLLVAAHLWEAISGHWQVAGEGQLMEQAWIRQQETVLAVPVSGEILYVYFLRFLFSFLGNHQQIVVGGNILLQLLGVFFFYRGGRRLINRTAALILTAVLGIVSVMNFAVTKDSEYHLLWFIWGLAFWLFSFLRPVVRVVRTKVLTKAAVEAEQAKQTEEVPPIPAKDKPEEKEEKKPPQRSAEKPSPTETGPGETRQREKVRLIPNPLPLPKKHVKKEMDYAFQPPRELMRYDLNNYNVTDDYDLKEG